MRYLTIAPILAALALAAPAHAEEIGECRFDRDGLTFAGTPLDQATCLLRKIELLAVRKPQKLPKVITQLMTDRKSTRLNSSHVVTSRMPSSA